MNRKTAILSIASTTRLFTCLLWW